MFLNNTILFLKNKKKLNNTFYYRTKKSSKTFFKFLKINKLKFN